ncbi:hypothetical protein SKAU_G00041320 [Synaphobranchus kaupii]|uniref:Uncharacterized protein n=1 Tax=Synaphobranchus kaupii TaxID=118154 RepID=A0A9Q1G173_SYNKA|nr:hypothetical protein SKAU_G00041320 [Synaphobranchus kaupii]
MAPVSLLTQTPPPDPVLRPYPSAPFLPLKINERRSSAGGRPVNTLPSDGCITPLHTYNSKMGWEFLPRTLELAVVPESRYRAALDHTTASLDLHTGSWVTLLAQSRNPLPTSPSPSSPPVLLKRRCAKINKPLRCIKLQ